MIGAVRCEDRDHDLLRCLLRRGGSFRHRRCHHGSSSVLYGPAPGKRSMRLKHASCRGWVVRSFVARRAYWTRRTEVAAFLYYAQWEAVNDDRQQQCQSMHQSEYWSGRSRSQRKTDEDNASTKYSGLKLGSTYWRARANAGRPPTHITQ